MTYSQMVSKAYFLTKTDSTSYSAADMVINMNNAYERVVSLIMQSDGRWQWDDSNQTDFPVATTTLTTDQQDYSFAVTHLEITRVELKDGNANWQLLQPINQNDVYNQSLTDFLKTSGTPKYYDKIASSLFLYPKPSYTQAASLKVYFKRPPSLFLSSDTTKVPGFNSLYHDLLPLWASYDYFIANNMGTAERVLREIQRKEDALVEDYALRSKDEHLKLSARQYYRSPFI